MAKICLCLTAKTLKRNLEILDKYRKFADVAELRVDCLESDERFRIRSFPEQAGLPVILAIRRITDGGYYASGEGSRVKLFAQGLAFANADRRRNFAYVDIEDDLDVPSLEEAARTFGTRIIRSYHNIHGVGENLAGRIRDMKRGDEDLVKIGVRTNSTEDVLRVFQAGRECADQEKILICMGQFGVYSRILTAHFGSYLSYVSVPSEEDVPKGAESQITIQELAELYRFKNITAATKVYGALGHSMENVGNEIFFNTIFGLEDIDAVFAPFPADSFSAFMRLARELNVSGLTVMDEYRNDALALARESSGEQLAGNCDTLIRSGGGWKGANAGRSGFFASLADYAGGKSLKRKKITVIGTGGMARAVTSQIHGLGARALILGRTAREAKELASVHKFAWGALDSRGIEMMAKYHDIIIRAENSETGAGDPLDMYAFSGDEHIIDLYRESAHDTFGLRAAQAGCGIISFHDMLIRQARQQYTLFFDREFPVRHIDKISFGRS